MSSFLRILGLLCIATSSTVFSQTPNQPRPQRMAPPPALSEQEFRDLVNEEEDPDSLFVIYQRYANEQIRRSPDIVLNLSEELLENESVPELNRRAYANYLKGLYWERPEPDSALRSYSLANQQFESIGFDQFVADTYIKQARLLSRLNRHLDAEELYFDLIDFLGDSDIEFPSEEMVFNELTDLYIRVGATELAVNRLNQLLEVGVESVDEECSIRLKMSNAYKRNRDLDESYNALIECADKNLTNPQLHGAILRSISDLERLRENPEEQLYWMKRSADFTTGNLNRDFPTYLFLAEAFKANKQYEHADSVVNILETADLRRIQVPMRIQFYNLKSNLLIQKEEFDQAIRVADEGINLAQRMPQMISVIDLFRSKAEALEAKGDFEEAYLVLKDIEQRELLIEEAGRIQMEQTNRVRFQMRDKNLQLESLNTEIALVRLRTFTIILIVIGFAAFLFYRYRLQSELKEEKTRTKIAHDLHDEVSATLTGITYFAEAVKQDRDAVKKSHFLNLISESAGDAKEKITDIVWSITPENDNWDLLLAKCRRYASDLFESKGIEYAVEIEDHIDGKLDMNTRQHIWMIFKEMVTNAARHAEATQIELVIKQTGNKLRIYVKDDGIGFDTTRKSDRNGISNIKSRAEQLNAEVKLVSSKGVGTTWELLVPVK